MSKSLLVISIIILLVLGFAFYWFEWRPTEIRKSCADTASVFSDGDRFYKNCVMQNGLEP